ncbi:MAG TPA: hypothetical protein VK961_00735 [Chthoniobacter sp.]|nr:hypothetical protein [Chthoniobacter sp.]
MNRRTKLLATKPQSLNSLAHLASNLRRTVSARLMREFGVRVPPALIRRVLDDATEIAQETGFPNLFFPAVAEEKARLVLASIGDHHPYDQTSGSLSHAA